jgi:para-nitrobenzyl esterase
MIRRKFLQGSLLAATHWAAGGKAFGNESPTGGADAFGPIIQTTAGKVRGYVADGVYKFKGIPYGAPAGGKARFLPPNPPPSWTGVRNTLTYGAMAMQGPAIEGYYAAVLRGLNAESPKNTSEDCLHLNVWSPELGTGHNRPVMVWLHPGAFNGWRGDSEWTDGTHLARNHDVLMVSLNHRLTAFGFLYLGDLSSDYAESGNVGMLDVVAALSWIQQNIAAFGGDPNNITIFGESGGGAKVATLLAMPPASGLFHKAIIESDVSIQGLTLERALEVRGRIARKLGIEMPTVEKFSEVPAAALVEAQRDEAFAPVVVAGSSLPHDPFFPDAPQVSSRVPILLGTNRTEAEYNLLADGLPTIATDDALQKYVEAHARRLGAEQVSKLVNLYHEFYPSESRETQLVAVLTGLWRDRAQLAAELKVKQAQAPVFMYEFDWDAPGFEHRLHACHTFEIPFAFDNVDAAPQLFGAKPDARRFELARRMSSAWAAFAHNGNPSHRNLPEWKPYDLDNRSTMMFGYSCKVVKDPWRAERLALEQFRPKMPSKPG